MIPTKKSLAHIYKIIAIISICFCSATHASDAGLILPMPGAKELNKIKQQAQKSSKQAQQTSHQRTSETLLPLPNKIKPAPRKPVTQSNQEVNSEPLIIQIKPKEKAVTPDEDNFPSMPDEVILQPDSLEPPEELPAGSLLTNEEPAIGSELPIFPKDTSSVVFMVMKTWKCEDYDGNTLLSHAVGVYSEEAGEQFQILGLSEEGKFNINLDEEDITLDELLDLVALKAGRDWGVDIPSKKIYFYPKGVESGTTNTW